MWPKKLGNIKVSMDADAGESNDEALLEVTDHDIFVAHIVEKATQDKELLYFELYVGGGNLETKLAKRKNVTVATFSLREWDFGKKAVRQNFMQLLRAERPHFVWPSTSLHKVEYKAEPGRSNSGGQEEVGS